MTTTEIQSLIDKHLAGWLGSGAAPDGHGFTLRDRIAAMIAEAEDARDKLWEDGAKTLTHERDVAQRVAKECQETNAQLEGMLRQAKEQIADDIYRTEHLKTIEACMWMHDDRTLDIPLGARLTSDGVTALRKQRDELRTQLDAMRQARNDAVQAAHMIAEELAQAKVEIERYENEPHK